jgi:hypothetical protein
LSSAPESSDEGACSVHEAERVENPRCGRRKLRRGKRPGEQRPTAEGQPKVGGTVSQGDVSFEVGEAGEKKRALLSGAQDDRKTDLGLWKGSP